MKPYGWAGWGVLLVILAVLMAGLGTAGYALWWLPAVMTVFVTAMIGFDRKQRAK